MAWHVVRPAVEAVHVGPGPQPELDEWSTVKKKRQVKEEKKIQEERKIEQEKKIQEEKKILEEKRVLEEKQKEEERKREEERKKEEEKRKAEAEKKAKERGDTYILCVHAKYDMSHHILVPSQGAGEEPPDFERKALRASLLLASKASGKWLMVMKQARSASGLHLCGLRSQGLRQRQEWQQER